MPLSYYPEGEVEVDVFPLKTEGPLVAKNTAHQCTRSALMEEGGHDTFFPLGEEEGKLHLHVTVVGGSHRGEPCQVEMVELIGHVQWQNEGEEPLLPLLAQGASSGEGVGRLDHGLGSLKDEKHSQT